VKKILLIRFSSIGDLVLTSPIIRALSTQMPGSEIHFLTKKRYQTVVENNPYIHQVHAFDTDLSDVLPTLKQENFDLIIDLHKNLRSFRVRQKLGVKSLSFDKLNFKKWLLVRFKINRLPKKHIVDRYFEGIQSIGVVNDQKGLDFFEGEENKNVQNLLPAEFQAGYVVFSLAGTYFTKQIPFEKWKEMLILSPMPVLLLGGKGEEKLANDLLSAVPAKTVLNGCGTFSLLQSAAFIRHAQLVITGDTGLMHIAAAYQKKVVSLWGNTVPDFGMYPYVPQHPERVQIIENKDLSCRPCSKLGFDHCPKGHFNCMMRLDVSNVFRQILEKDSR